MRTEENWEQRSKHKILKQSLTLRLIKDLERINPPELHEIESTFIFGDTESGKTIRAAFMFIEYLKQQWLKGETLKGQFVSFPTILKELEDSFENKEVSKSSIMDKYATTPLLVIDDFMTRRPTDWVYDVFYYIINYRYENVLPTIITSNLSLNELSEVLDDDRITSRIRRMCKIEQKIANY